MSEAEKPLAQSEPEKSGVGAPVTRRDFFNEVAAGALGAAAGGGGGKQR